MRPRSPISTLTNILLPYPPPFRSGIGVPSSVAWRLSSAPSRSARAGSATSGRLRPRSASAVPPVGRAAAKAVVFDGRTEAVPHKAVGRPVLRVTPAIDIGTSGPDLQQQAISCLTGRQTRLAHMVSDLIRVGPEAAIAGSGRIDDVDVPAAAKGVSLGVQDLEHDDVALTRSHPRLQGAHPAGPAGHGR